MALTNPNEITFGEKGDKYVPTKYDGRNIKLYLGSPDEPLEAPFGISNPIFGSTSDNLTTDLAVDGELLTQFVALDQLIVQTAVARSQEWFGRQLSEAEVRVMHTPLVQPPTKEGGRV